MVYIEPATRLRTDYNRIADLARRTAEPVYITRNGTTEVVVMDIKAFQQRELVLKLGNVVLEGELKRRNGTATLSIEEMEALLKHKITTKILRDLKELALFYPAANIIRYEPLKSQSFRFYRSAPYVCICKKIENIIYVYHIAHEDGEYPDIFMRR